MSINVALITLLLTRTSYLSTELEIPRFFHIEASLFRLLIWFQFLGFNHSLEPFTA